MLFGCWNNANDTLPFAHITYGEKVFRLVMTNPINRRRRTMKFNYIYHARRNNNNNKCSVEILYFERL